MLFVFSISSAVCIRVFFVLISFCTSVFSSFIFRLPHELEFSVMLFQQVSEFSVVFSVFILVSDWSSMLLVFECVVVSVVFIFSLVCQFFVQSVVSVVYLLWVFQLFFIGVVSVPAVLRLVVCVFECVSYVVRVFSMSLRLCCNLMSGHVMCIIVIESFSFVFCGCVVSSLMWVTVIWECFTVLVITCLWSLDLSCVVIQSFVLVLLGEWLSTLLFTYV